MLLEEQSREGNVELAPVKILKKKRGSAQVHEVEAHPRRRRWRASAMNVSQEQITVDGHTHSTRCLQNRRARVGRACSIREHCFLVA